MKVKNNIIAHRGMFNNKDIPENSYLAFKKAIENNYDFELDVQITADNKLVVFHDYNLKRMCKADINVQESTYKELLNKPTNYTFYKLDEYNKPLDGAKFKLQKLNSDKKYEDVPVTMETGESGKTYYRVDDTSTNYIIETVNGEGTVYYLSEGQYRILEVVPPEGYELPAKSINAATFVVDEDGQIFGGSVITNKPKTEKINAYAEAKLIINIQTGQTILNKGLKEDN